MISPDRRAHRSIWITRARRFGIAGFRADTALRTAKHNRDKRTERTRIPRGNCFPSRGMRRASDISAECLSSVRTDHPSKNESAPDSSSHGTPLSNNPPPKTALTHLTFCSARAQLPVVTRFMLPRVLPLRTTGVIVPLMPRILRIPTQDSQRICPASG